MLGEILIGGALLMGALIGFWARHGSKSLPRVGVHRRRMRRADSEIGYSGPLDENDLRVLDDMFK